MMEEQPLGVRAIPERKSIGERRVTPADVLGVLAVGVLAIVDQQRGVASEVEPGDPVVVKVRE